MARDSSSLGTESLGKLLLRLSLPAVTAQIVNLLYNVVDRIYIGHIPGIGSYALTGVGLCLPLIMIISAFAAICSQGGGPRASIFLGAGDKESAQRTMGSCLAFLLCISAILTALSLVFSKPILMVFGASQNTIAYSMDYMSIYALGTVFVQISLGMNAFITAQGYARTSMLTVIIGAACNIVLDPILIFTLGMGVKGAALATIISQAVSAAWVLSFLASGKSELRLQRKIIVLERRFIKPVIALGLGPFIMQSTESLLNMSFNINLQRYGGDLAVGAMTILSSVMQASSLPVIGIGQGAQPILSYSYGSGNARRLEAGVHLLFRTNFIIASAIWLWVQLFPSVFVSAFTADASLAAFSSKALRVYMAVSLLMSIQQSIQQTFVSIGFAKASIAVALMRKFVLLIPLIFILPSMLEDKTMAVYLAEPVSDTLSVTFATCLFIILFRKVLKRMKEGSS